MPALRDHLPPLYRDLLPTLFAAEVPEERKATCGSCSMCQGSCDNAVDALDGRSRLFRADTKCCTYHPRLPNYLVGALLDDEDPALAEGRRRVRERLAGRLGATPQWLRPPARFELLYQSSRNAFGRTAALRCPYYDAQPGACTIWRYREAVCSTYFCKYVAAEDGQRLWTSVKTFLALVEAQLSRWALLQLSPELLYATLDAPKPSGALSIEDLEEAPLPPREHQALWRDYAGREEELYRACHARVRGLSAADLERILGLDGEVQLGALRRRLDAALRPTLPGTLRLNPAATLRPLRDGTVGVAAYSELDALALPREAWALLQEFRGDEPLPALRRRLREESGVDFDDELLVLLHQHRVLI